MKEVRLENLVKRFAEVTAVSDLSLHIGKGELLTLLGPSGCGKTTTLNMIAGFEKPDAGEIHVGDRLISSTTKNVLVPPHKRNLGMMFQSYGLWPHFTVHENIAFGLRMRRVPRDEIARRVREALRLVRLDGYGDRYPAQLSGGQQQRIAFARAIVYEPDVLLLDEPLSNLDAALREEMRLELRELHDKTGLTTIFVTHDQLEAMVMSDRIVVMRDGRVEQAGRPEEIYSAPANRFVASFIGIANLLEGRIVSAPGPEGLGTVSVADQTVHCRVGPSGQGARLLLNIRPEDWHVAAARPEETPVNLLRGQVEKSVYMGALREIWLRLGGQRVRVHAHHGLAAEPGAELYLWVEPDAVKAIPDEAPAAGPGDGP